MCPTILGFLGAIALGFVLPPRYRSSTLILVESEKVPDTFVKIATDTMGRRLQTIQQEVLSRTRLETVLSELNPYPNHPGKVTVSSLVERMRGSILIQTKGADAFMIEYEHTDPAMAMRVATRLATLFIGEAERDREKQTVEGVEFIDSQLAESRHALEEKEESLRRFKEERLGSLPEQLQTNLATLQRLQLEQQTVSESLRATQTRVDLLQQSLQQEIHSAAGTADDPSAQLVQLRAQLASLRTRYTDEHPDVQGVLRRIQALEKGEAGGAPAFDPDGTSPRAQLTRARVELETLQARRTRIEGDMARLQAQVDKAPRTEQQLSTLTRDYSQMADNYAALLKKQMEARMAENLERRWKGERFRVLDPAHVPEEPFYPNRPLFALLGLAGGLGIGLLLAFTAEYLDHSVKGEHELAELFPDPILCSVPFIAPNTSRRTRRAKALEDSDGKWGARPPG
jgi:polysaccharide chain length determinant protein (PEP-CTERM system associated)